MTKKRPQSLAARARARFDGSGLRARMSPAGVRQQIRLGNPESRAANWPENSTSTSDFARAVSRATKSAGDIDPGGS